MNSLSYGKFVHFEDVPVSLFSQSQYPCIYKKIKITVDPKAQKNVQFKYNVPVNIINLTITVCAKENKTKNNSHHSTKAQKTTGK